MPFHVPVEPADRVFAISGMREMSLTLRLDGCLDVERVRSAIQQMLNALPLMRCRFVEHWWQPRWDVSETTSVDDLLTIHTSDNRTCIDACQTKRAIQFELQRGTNDTLIIRLDHVLGDFRTLQKLVQIFADTYSAMERDPAYLLPSFPPCERGFRPYVTRLNSRERRQIRQTGFEVLKETQRAGKWRAPQPRDSIPKDSNLVVKHSFTVAEVEQLEEYALQRQATVFQTLLAAYFLAATEVLSQSDALLPVCVLVDLRRRFGQGAPFSFGNLVGLETILLSQSPRPSLDSVLEAIRQHMFEKRRNCLGETFSSLFYECLPLPIRLLVGMVPYAWKARQHQRHLQRAVAQGELTQVAATFGGTFNRERTRFGETRVREIEGNFRPVDATGLWAMHAFGFNGQLSLSFGWGSVETMRAVKEAFLRAMSPAFESVNPL